MGEEEVELGGLGVWGIKIWFLVRVDAGKKGEPDSKADRTG